jgi:hypothetical protein
MDSPLDRPSIGSRIAPRAPALRARITNHKDLLPGLDGRTSAARRFRDLVSRYIVDIGGLDCCSEIKLGLLRRLAAATVQAELLESRMVSGEQIDVSQLCTLASTCVRLAQRIGIERVARGIERPPTLDAYLNRNGKYGAHDEEELEQ